MAHCHVYELSEVAGAGEATERAVVMTDRTEAPVRDLQIARATCTGPRSRCSGVVLFHLGLRAHVEIEAHVCFIANAVLCIDPRLAGDDTGVLFTTLPGVAAWLQPVATRNTTQPTPGTTQRLKDLHEWFLPFSSGRVTGQSNDLYMDGSQVKSHPVL